MNKNSKITPPSNYFIGKLKELTNGNYHGQCYYEVAKWCMKKAISSGMEKDVCEYFLMFRELFFTINTMHHSTGNNPFCSMRYEIGKEMFDTIERYFGSKVVDAFNRGMC